MPRHDDTPRDLLFGLLALQNGLIVQEQLLDAFRAWSQARDKTLAEILVERKSIDEEDRAILAAMAEKQLKKHGGQTDRSLAAVAAAPSTLETLAALGDPELIAILPHVATHSPWLDANATMSVGTATSEGQRFQVLRPHARGGLGAVFVALDTELNREVALKQILDHHADDAISRTRFLIEAEITGGLEHPGIVPVYGLGHYSDGRPYYTMRFIRGESLKEAIAAFHRDEGLKRDPGKRSLALRKLLRRFVDVCNAIDYAHGRGVIHRDIKPGNVIVGRHGETLVVDWGLAKPLGHSESASGEASDERTLIPSSSSGSAETLAGSAIGTPAYMSPEQANGDLDRLGPRSDVYSLGATLYCLLAGKPPFEGADVGAVLRAVQKGAFPRPRQVDPSIDPALEAVCLKALAVRPEDRHATARSLADDVERWGADEPVSAWREPASVRARRWMRRHRTAVTAATATVLMAVVGLAGMLAVQSRANRALMAKNAELDTANGRVQARFDLARDAIRSFQAAVNEDDMLRGEELKGLRDKLLRSAASFYEKLEKLIQDQPDRSSPAILAQSYFELGDLIAKIGIKPEALAVHRKALAIRRELAARPDANAGAKLDVARSLIAVATLAESAGDGASALSAIKEARDLAAPLATGPGATDADREILAKSLQGIGFVLASTGQSTQALESYREALAIRRKLADDHPDVTEFQSGLAENQLAMAGPHAETGHPGEALESCREVLAIYRKLVADHPDVTEFRSRMASDLSGIGLLQTLTGQSTRAMESYREALAIRRKLVADHPAVTEFRANLGNILNRIGVLLVNTGHRAEGLESYREALAVRRKLAGDHPSVAEFRDNFAQILHNIGLFLSRAGHPAEALESYREALAIHRELADKHPDVTSFRSALANDHNSFGLLLSEVGQIAESLASHREALAIYRKLVADHPAVIEFHPYVARSLNNIGILCARAGQTAEAFESYREALAIRRKLADEHPDVTGPRTALADSLHDMGSLRERTGQTAEALESYGEALTIRRKLADEHPEITGYQDDLALSYGAIGQAHALSGDFVGAIAEYRRAIAILEPYLTSDMLYNQACYRSLLAGVVARPGSGVANGVAQAEAIAAMSTLKRAVERGYRNFQHMRGDTDLDPLRSRPDFQLLMMDLAMPAIPFAR